MGYGLGALKDPADIRDFELRKVITPIKLPATIDYEKDMSPVRNQGERGACVAFAALAVKEFQERKQRRGKPIYDFSEEWIYRLVMHPGGGAYPRDAFKQLMDAGVPREKFMPYDPSLSDAEKLPFCPTPGAIRNARYYKAQSFARLTSIEEMRQSLAINGPFLIGITWYDGWFNPSGGEYPIINESIGRDVGGHAIAIVGYDDEKKAFKLRNSWGEEWGKSGYAYISYDVIHRDSMDAWTSLDVTSKNVKMSVVSKLKERVDAN